jgi:formylglycine-generating enzyme required for sulfatase activity
VAATSPNLHKNMVHVPGGTFRMGSEEFYPEERPVHTVSVDAFWIDEHLVTVADYRRFVKATGYLTYAERPLDPAMYPGADPDLLVPGSLVFRQTRGRVPLDDYRQWWSFVPGASWRHPEGPASTIVGRDRHPVTQVNYEDAGAYAAWIGKTLPTEAEWELAARGGLDGKRFTWGDEETPRGKRMANTWQGEFPWQNTLEDGFLGTSPVKSFPPNGYGLFDMAGNVWEWTADFYVDRHPDEVAHPCCAPHNPRVDQPVGDPGDGTTIPRRVTKGGSHLCAPSYCLRYRPAARQGEAVDTGTTHIGFRCVVR